MPPLPASLHLILSVCAQHGLFLLIALIEFHELREVREVDFTVTIEVGLLTEHLLLIGQLGIIARHCEVLDSLVVSSVNRLVAVHVTGNFLTSLVCTAGDCTAIRTAVNAVRMAVTVR